MLKKISKVFSAIYAILRKPYLLNAVLEAEDLWKDRVIKKYPDFKELPDVSFIELCGSQPEPAEPYTYLEGGSLPTDIILLRSLAKRFTECSYFEIGTWRGESVANVAKIAKECVTVNLSAREILAMGGSEAYAKAHFFFSENLKNVRQIEQNTVNLNFKTFNKKYDLVFIDGDHHYDMICHDTKKVFENLVHENTIVVWHDYAFNPEIVRYEVLQGILDSLPKEKHHQLFHVSNTLCAVYLPFEIKSQMKSYPQQPEGYFKVDISWNKL